MTTPMTIESEITIKATKDKVWDALVNPEQTKKYMYGCEPVSDWTPGAPLLWNGEYEGKQMTFVKGNIVAIRPGEYLEYTVIDPNNPDVPDIPDNYLNVTYTLTEKEGVTTLAVTQGDYSHVADGQKRYEDANKVDGWNSILQAIKSLIEEGKALDVVPE